MSNIGSAIDGLDPVARAFQEQRRRMELVEARLTALEDQLGAALAGVAPTPPASSQSVTAPTTTPWAAPRMMPTAHANTLDTTANLDRLPTEAPPVAPEAQPASPTSHGLGAARRGAVGPVISASNRRSGS